MRPPLTGRETRALLSRVARGASVLVWDGERFLRVTPEGLRGALPPAEAAKLKKET